MKYKTKHIEKEYIVSKVKFGTDGIRGKADLYPFTNDGMYYFSKALAQWSTQKYKKQNPKVLIGYDTRISSPHIKNMVIKGLKALPLHIVDAGILPTPAICQLIQKKYNKQQFDFGIVISASHNPYYDNGIKIFDSQQTKIGKVDEKIILNYFTQNETDKNIDIQNAKSTVELWKGAWQTYIKHISSFFKPNFLQNITIALDCANGATSTLAPQIFTQFGATVKTICNTPDGKNINENCGSQHPQQLQQAIQTHNADIGFAFDGDGDRLLAVNIAGDILEGDDLLTLLSEHPIYKKEKTVVGTIMSNLGLAHFLQTKNKKLLRTPVGDKYVCAKLLEKNLMLGGELSGHLVMQDYLRSSDGIFAALRVMESLLANNNMQAKTFTKVPQILINVPVEQKHDLQSAPYANIIEKEQKALQNGRIIVRYSGTENLLRIMVEYNDQAVAKQIAKKLAEELI